MNSESLPIGTVAKTRPPAKLNLFLELLARRDDGFHEIDTVMVPIDLCDEMSVRTTDDDRISLSVSVLPSSQVVANEMGIASQSADSPQLPQIPSDDRNLVWRVLDRFRQTFDIKVGFSCELKKRIPAGAGMGGASSDAASALLCAAILCGVKTDTPELVQIAAEIGSDVPFFMGCGAGGRVNAAQATGRGEKLCPLDSRPMDFVVVFPNESLSTAEVYGACTVPVQPRPSALLIGAMSEGELTQIAEHMFNRLSAPAEKILPRIDEILKSMWRCGLQACQLTGSGSACFALQESKIQAKSNAERLRTMLEPGAFVTRVQTTSVPAPVVIG